MTQHRYSSQFMWIAPLTQVCNGLQHHIILWVGGMIDDASSQWRCRWNCQISHVKCNVIKAFAGCLRGRNRTQRIAARLSQTFLRCPLYNLTKSIIIVDLSLAVLLQGTFIRTSFLVISINKGWWKLNLLDNCNTFSRDFLQDYYFLVYENFHIILNSVKCTDFP